MSGPVACESMRMCVHPLCLVVLVCMGISEERESVWWIVGVGKIIATYIYILTFLWAIVHLAH